MVDRNDQLDTDQEGFVDPDRVQAEPFDTLGQRAVQSVVEIKGVPYTGTEKPAMVERYAVYDPLTNGL